MRARNLMISAIALMTAIGAAAGQHVASAQAHRATLRYTVRYFPLEAAGVPISALADSGWSVRGVTTIMTRFAPGPEVQALAVVFERTTR